MNYICSSRCLGKVSQHNGSTPSSSSRTPEMSLEHPPDECQTHYIATLLRTASNSSSAVPRPGSHRTKGELRCITALGGAHVRGGLPSFRSTHACSLGANGMSVGRLGLLVLRIRYAWRVQSRRLRAMLPWNRNRCRMDPREITLRRFAPNSG